MKVLPTVVIICSLSMYAILLYRKNKAHSVWNELCLTFENGTRCCFIRSEAVRWYRERANKQQQAQKFQRHSSMLCR